MARTGLPATYAKKFSKMINKRIGTNKPDKSWSGKGGSTSKYGGSKVKRNHKG